MVDIKYKRMSDESIDDHVWRICSNKDNGKYELTWEQVSEILNFEHGEPQSYTSSKWRKEYQAQKRGFDRAIELNADSVDAISELKLQVRELYLERQKLRDEKNEYNAWLREQSRAELMFERIDESIDRYLGYKGLEIPNLKPIEKGNEEIVVGIADAHFGADFKIEGLKGDVIVEYNPEIAKERLFALGNEIVDFARAKGISKLNICELGDAIEGILHLSQLKALKGNIVDDILDYADLFVDFIYSLLLEGFHISIYTSEGNHSDLRLLTGKKGDFPHENLEKIFSRVVKKAFANVDNIEVKSNVRGINYFNVCGKNILTVHGQDEKNILNSINEYEDVYDVDIDYLMLGHLHSKRMQDANGGKEVIQVRSLMGGNDFSVKIKKLSDAGAYIFTIKEGYGIRDSRDVKFTS